MADYENVSCPWFWRNLHRITRIWGLITAVVLLGVGADLVVHHELAGGFSIAASLLVLFLELTWAVSLFLQVSLRNENHTAFQCWDAVLWINTWKKAVIYCTFGVVLFVQPHRIWLSTIASLLLFSLGLLHLSHLYLERITAQACLLEQDELNRDRYDEVIIHGEFDDSVPLPIIVKSEDQEAANNCLLQEI